MQVRRFFAPTVAEALEAARDALGSDAFVLSAEFVRTAGWRGWIGGRVVAVTAAADRPGGRHLVSVDRTPIVLPPVRQAVNRSAGAVAKLTAAGIDSATAEEAVQLLSPEECRVGSPDALRRVLACAYLPLASTPGPTPQVEVFVGPPGVGKTTTIAKIVAQERCAGGDPRDLIAADAFRVGAVDHLRGYAAIIGSAFRVARDAEDLDDCLRTTRRAVLVDTAGGSPGDACLRDVLAVIGRQARVRTHLVLAADTSAASAERLLDRYAIARPDRVVVTKMDESATPAPLFGVLRRRGLPVSYLAYGQHVPEDLVVATPEGIVSALLGELPLEIATCH